MRKVFVFILLIAALTAVTSCSKAGETSGPVKPAEPLAVPVSDKPAQPEASAAASEEVISQAPVAEAPAASAPAEPVQTAPEAAEPVETVSVKAQEKVKTFTLAGFDIIAKISETETELAYPSDLSKDDILGFIAYVNSRYPEYTEGLYFTFKGNNRLVLSYSAEAAALDTCVYWINQTKYAVDEYLAYLEAEKQKAAEAEKLREAQLEAIAATPAAPAVPAEEKPVEVKPATVKMISAQQAAEATAASKPGTPTSAQPEQEANTVKPEEDLKPAEAKMPAEAQEPEESAAPSFKRHIIEVTADSNNFFNTSAFKIGVDGSYTYKITPGFGVGAELGWADSYGFHALAKVNGEAIISDFFSISGGIGGGVNLYSNKDLCALAGAEAGFDFNISKSFGITLKTGIRYYFAVGDRAAQFEWRPVKLGIKIGL